MSTFGEPSLQSIDEQGEAHRPASIQAYPVTSIPTSGMTVRKKSKRSHNSQVQGSWNTLVQAKKHFPSTPLLEFALAVEQITTKKKASSEGSILVCVHI